MSIKKTIVLMRHGEADMGLLGGDHGRQLNAAGRIQVASVSKKLEGIGISPDRIFCSDATRTTETLEIYRGISAVDSQIHFESKLYEATEDDFFEYVFQLEDQEQHILFVGHNPLLSYLASRLSETYVGLKPSDAIVLEIDSATWKEAVSGWELKHHVKAY